MTWSLSTTLDERLETVYRENVRYWIACDLIRSQMRQDLDDRLDAFAARWGIQR
jgi:hypothetical protein